MTTGPEAPATDATTGAGDESFTTTLGAVDTEATQRLSTLQLVYQARLSRLSRNATSIAVQQGAGSAQSVAAQTAAAAARTTAARIGVVQQQVTTEVPAVAATGWALHGRVYTAELEPAVAYCVFLVDAQKAYYAPSGFAYTDSTGYFLLTYPGPASETTDSAAEPQPGGASQAPALYPEVTNPKGKPVYLGTTPFTPVLGGATYQAVPLPPGEAPIGDPPRAVRATASPRSAAGTRRRKPATGA
jgi:hypothetical protein